MCNDLPAFTASSGHDWYRIVKDFLPSLMTFIAASTAMLITFYFNRQQTATALRAVDIAHDRLRFDLFEKRYAIYEAARNAIEITFERSNEDKMPDELNAMFLKFEEVTFLFSKGNIFIFGSASQGHKRIPYEELPSQEEY